MRGGSPRPIDGYLTKAADGLNWLKIGDVDKEAKYVAKTEEKVRPEALNKTRVVSPGDLILSNSMSFGRPYLMKIKSCIHDGWIAITKPSELVSREYLYYLIFSPTSQSYFLNNAAGSGVLNLNAEIIRALPVAFPSSLEQQKIADCLSCLDDLIAAETQKLDTLKAHQKGLMQQLFPREEEAVPRLRFPEFLDAGEWERLSLSTQVNLISGLHLAPDEYADTGEVPYFTGPSDFSNELTSVKKWTIRSENSGRTGDILITVKGNGVGELLYLILDGVAIGRQLMAVRPSKAYGKFVFHFLATQRKLLIALASGNLIPGLSRGDILGLKAFIPKYDEQQKIADCLSSIDDLITAQCQKIDILKIHKKGLMQQLFPALDEVPA